MEYGHNDEEDQEEEADEEDDGLNGHSCQCKSTSVMCCTLVSVDSLSHFDQTVGNIWILSIIGASAGEEPGPHPG